MTSGHSHDDRDAPAEDSRADDRLAQAARSAHAASLDHLSRRVRAQLVQRRRAALAENARPSSARRWPMLALGSAAALTLANGLFVLRGPGETGTPAQGEVAVAPTGVAPDPTPAVPTTATTPVITTDPAPAVASSAVASTGTGTPEPAVESILSDDDLPAELLAAEFSGTDAAMGFEALEESPDFYLWLGSDTAQADTSELL